MAAVGILGSVVASLVRFFAVSAGYSVSFSDCLPRKLAQAPILPPRLSEYLCLIQWQLLYLPVILPTRLSRPLLALCTHLMTELKWLVTLDPRQLPMLV